MVSFKEVMLSNDLPVYVQLVKFIKIQIHLKRIENGDELPSRRDLAGRLGINPNTVQKAYKQLESEGILQTGANVKSLIFLNDDIQNGIALELTRETVSEFIDYAKSINLTFKDTVELITRLWD